MAIFLENSDKILCTRKLWPIVSKHMTLVDGAITEDAALETLNYRVNTRPLYRFPVGAAAPVAVPGAFTLVRTDIDSVVYPSVGSAFTPLQNEDMLRRLFRTVLQPNPDDVFIESVGSLSGGRVAFINLHLGTFQVPGAAHPTVNRLGVFNVHGGSKIRAAVHDTVVGSGLTSRRAELSAQQWATCFEVRHTRRVAQRVGCAVDALSTLREVVETANREIIALSDDRMSREAFDAFLNELFPSTDPSTDLPIKGRDDIRDEVWDAWYSLRDDMTDDLRNTWYGAYQAVCTYADMRNSAKKDAGSFLWNGLFGTEASLKEKALTLMQSAGHGVL
jgi:hypothetical protein